MILFKLYSQMLTHDRMASCQSWGRARAWAEGDYGKIFFMPSREFILLLILLEALPEERPLPTPEEVDARLTSLSLPPPGFRCRLVQVLLRGVQQTPLRGQLNGGDRPLPHGSLHRRPDGPSVKASLTEAL